MKVKKRILSIFLCTAMLLGSALPTYAVEPDDGTQIDLATDGTDEISVQGNEDQGTNEATAEKSNTENNGSEDSANEDFAEKYLCKEQYNSEADAEYVKAVLQDCLDSKEENIDKLLEMFLKSDHEEVWIHPWKYVPYSELD